MVRKFHVRFGKQERLYGQVLLPDGVSIMPGAILCHGLGSGRGAMQPSALSLAKKGVAALVFDFRGHGKSRGIFDGNEADDVIEAWQWLSCFDGVDSDRIALIGHSMGARAAILAASRINSPRAIIALSCLPDMDEMLAGDVSVSVDGLLNASDIAEYPRAGALPWVNGVQAMFSRLWMYLHGYRLRVDWKRFLETVPDIKVSTALQNLGGCPKLFVHFRGDRHIPYRAVVEMYQKAPEPRELILAEGGYHAAPLMPGSVRKRWINWVIDTLKAGG